MSEANEASSAAGQKTEHRREGGAKLHPPRSHPSRSAATPLPRPVTPAATPTPSEQPLPVQAPDAATSTSGNTTKLKLAAWVRKAAVGGIQFAGVAAYRACALINAPLAKASDQTRKLVGYAGLVTAFNGSILLLIKFISSMKG